MQKLLQSFDRGASERPWVFFPTLCSYVFLLFTSKFFLGHMHCGVLISVIENTGQEKGRNSHKGSLPPRSLLFPSPLPFPSLPFPSLPFPSLPFPSLPFPSLPFPSLPFPSLPLRALPCPSCPAPASVWRLTFLQFRYQDRYSLLPSIHSKFRCRSQFQISTVSLNPQYSTNTPITNLPITPNLMEVTNCRCGQRWMCFQQCARTRCAPVCVPHHTSRIDLPTGQLVTQQKGETKGSDKWCTRGAVAF